MNAAMALLCVSFFVVRLTCDIPPALKPVFFAVIILTGGIAAVNLARQKILERFG